MSKLTKFQAGATVKNKAGRSTRKMQMSRLLAGIAAMAVVFLITLLFSKNSKTIGSYGLGASVFVFVVVVAAIKYLEKYGLDKAKRSKDAERGAEAEEAVGAILGNLPEGNFVINDFNSGKGNIDHILIGPKGIFTLETKSHTGKVSFDGKKLLRNGRPFEKDFLKQTWAQWYLVREILAKWGITTPLSEPVILFTNAFIEVRGKAKGIDIVGIKYFRNFSNGFPTRYRPPRQVGFITGLKLPPRDRLSSHPTPPWTASSPAAGRGPACPACSIPAAPCADGPIPQDRKSPPW